MLPKLRNLFTDDDVQYAIECTTVDGVIDYVWMSRILSNLHDGVTPELAKYWSRQFEVKKKNGDAYLTLAPANRELKNARQKRVPNPADLEATVEQPTDPERILVFGDTHAPYHHPDAVDFLARVAGLINPTMVVHVGDEVDHHALSFHDSDPNLDSAGKELVQARLFINDLHDVFPYMRILESNHGSLAYRRAKAFGLPTAYIKSYREILFPHGGGEGWSWHHRIRIENEYGRDFQFQHEGKGDLMTLAAHENANITVGHEHSKFGIGYNATMVDTYWSMYLGWLGDISSMAFAYGKEFPKKPVLGCGLIIGGVPSLVPMQVDRHNRWTGRL